MEGSVVCRGLRLGLVFHSAGQRACYLRWLLRKKELRRRYLHAINVELLPVLLRGTVSGINFIHSTHISIPFNKVNPVLMQV